MNKLILIFCVFISLSSFSQVSTTLDGSGSNDPDGSIPVTGYTWRQISGQTVTLATPSLVKTSVTFTVAGVYVFGLIVKDNEGALSLEDSVQITVLAANQRPKANAGQDQNLKLPGLLGIYFKNKKYEDNINDGQLYIASVMHKNSDNHY